MIKEAILKLLDNHPLTYEETEQVMEEILTGQLTNSQISAFLVLMRQKGETSQELTAAVQVMRKHSCKIKIDRKVILDTCGTGGDRKGSFNFSTVTAFIASGAGITVAKHGNRSVSSSCGSADILEALGIDVNMDQAKIRKCLEDIGMAFLFAPNFHPAMKYAMPVRKELGVRTIFNILGPLTNPAGATHQLLGVYDPKWLEPLATVLKNLKTVRAMVVYGKDGLDEITTTDKTLICELKNGQINSYEIDPGDFAIDYTKPQDLIGKDAAFNATILIDILKGRQGAYRQVALLNAGCAIYVSDVAKDIKQGIKLARESIDSGKALEKLERLRKYSRS
jgi:anthranilate phosphoribosyltransferase